MSSITKRVGRNAHTSQMHARFFTNQACFIALATAPVAFVANLDGYHTQVFSLGFSQFAIAVMVMASCYVSRGELAIPKHNALIMLVIAVLSLGNLASAVSFGPCLMASLAWTQAPLATICTQSKLAQTPEQRRVLRRFTSSFSSKPVLKVLMTRPDTRKLHTFGLGCIGSRLLLCSD